MAHSIFARGRRTSKLGIFVGLLALIASLVAPVPAGAQDAPRIEAYPLFQSISALGFAPGSTVTFELFDGVSLITHIEETADINGLADTGFRDLLILTPGRRIEVSDGSTSKDLTLEPIDIESVDLDLDRVAGTTSPAEPVGVDVFTDPDFETFATVAGGDGSWSVDATDITTTSQVRAFVTDADGDRTFDQKDPPRIEVFLGEENADAACTMENSFFPGALVTFSVFESVAPGADTIFSGTQIADETGGTCLDLFGRQLDPGNVVRATDGVFHKEHVVPALTLDLINPVAETLSGTATPGTEVQVNFADRNNTEAPDGNGVTEVIADGSGDWVADFSAEDDVTITSEGVATFCDDDGDCTYFGKGPRFLNVDMSADTMTADNFPPGGSVTFEVFTDPDDASPETYVTTADTTGHAEAVAEDLVGGNLVIADNSLGELSAVLPDFTIDTFDPFADTASGTAPADAEFGIASHCGLTEHGVTAGAGGAWETTYSGDFRHQAELCGLVGAGLTPIVGFVDVGLSEVTPIISADPATNDITLDGFAPDTTMIVQVISSGGPLVVHSSDEVITDNAGHAELLFTEHGQTLVGKVVNLPETLDALEVVPFTVDIADPLENIVAGTAPDGSLVMVSVDLQLTKRLEVVDGSWELDIGALPRPPDCLAPDCEWPYPWGLDSIVEASVVDADGDRTALSVGAAEVASGDVGAGGTVTTDTEADGATDTDPVETWVTTPGGGSITLREEQLTQQAPETFAFLGQEVDIDAPVESAADPLVIALRVDATRVPKGESAQTLQIYRNGDFVPDCSGPVGQASPDPCVTTRAELGDGDIELTLLSSQASDWNAAASTDARPPTVTEPSFSANPRFQSQATEVLATAADELSGIGGGELFIGTDPGEGQGTSMVVTGSTLEGEIGTLPTGEHEVSVRARDKAGNWSEVESATLTVQDDPPGGGGGGGGGPAPTPVITPVPTTEPSAEPTPAPAPSPSVSQDPEGEPLPASECDPATESCGTTGSDQATVEEGTVITGAGADTIDVHATEATEEINVDTGAGDDEINIDVDSAAEGTMTIDTGEGDDVVTLSVPEGATNLEIVIITGSGADEIDWSALEGTGIKVTIITGGGGDFVAAPPSPGTNQIVINLGSGNDVFKVVSTPQASAARRAAVSGERLTAAVGGKGYEASGASGDDRLVGGAGRDSLNGGLGADALIGKDGADNLRGGPGNDTLRGGPGGDALSGGSGRDSCAGGTGRDSLNNCE